MFTEVHWKASHRLNRPVNHYNLLILLYFYQISNLWHTLHYYCGHLNPRVLSFILRAVSQWQWAQNDAQSVEAVVVTGINTKYVLDLYKFPVPFLLWTVAAVALNAGTAVKHLRRAKMKADSTHQDSGHSFWENVSLSWPAEIAL